jgi:hypothetical protein
MSGFFPYINIPTLYIFETTQISAMIVKIITITEISISNAGTDDTQILKSIIIGEVKGIIDKMIENKDSGFPTIYVIIRIGKMRGIKIIKL